MNLKHCFYSFPPSVQTQILPIILDFQGCHSSCPAALGGGASFRSRHGRWSLKHHMVALTFMFWHPAEIFLSETKQELKLCKQKRSENHLNPTGVTPVYHMLELIKFTLLSETCLFLFHPVFIGFLWRFLWSVWTVFMIRKSSIKVLKNLFQMLIINYEMKLSKR